MPLGIVSDDEFTKELTNSSPNKSEETRPKVVTGEVISPLPRGHNGGRTPGAVEVPESLKKLIGEEAAINGRQAGLELAKQFGISNSSVSAYSNGATSTASYNTPEVGLKTHIDDSRMRIIRKAKLRLNKTLSEITDEKLAGAKLRDLAVTARALSGVITAMEPNIGQPGSDVVQPQFVVFAPTLIKEEHFGTLILKE